MNDIGASLPAIRMLIEQRLALLRDLAESLELISGALARNDAEAIARGAAHQAELCRQWSCLEDELRREASERSRLRSRMTLPGTSGDSQATEHSARLQAEWESLGARIRYLVRVHWSLLRHLERSLAILNRLVDSCATTYTPDAGLSGASLCGASLSEGSLAATGVAGTEVRLRAGE